MQVLKITLAVAIASLGIGFGLQHIISYVIGPWSGLIVSVIVAYYFGHIMGILAISGWFNKRRR
jgi:hypothetical protein